MQDLQSLIQYISEASPIFVIGAGPSCDAGLPSWKRLASFVLEELRIATNKDIEPAEEAFAKEDFAYVLGFAAKTISTKWLYEKCSLKLKDEGHRGEQYRLITKLPALGYLTTNFDSLLREHLADAGKALTTLRNTHDDLAQVDFPTHRTIVKIHSDFDAVDSIILTDRQYRDVLHDPRFLPLRTFLSAQLQANRIVFIGYSFNDPDLTFLLEATTRALRRRVPLFGIIANARAEKLDEWYENYNLRVVSYRAPNEDHSSLKSILESLVSYFSAQSRNDREVPFAAAQSLYMWHKLHSLQGAQATSDALKAIVLGMVAGQEGSLTTTELERKLSGTVLRITTTALNSALDSTLSRLVKDSLLTLTSDGRYFATPTGKQIQKRYADQFNNLKLFFETQVYLDLRARLPTLREQSLFDLVNVIHSCLLQVFNERGGELANSALTNKFEAPSSLDLVRTIGVYTRPLEDTTRFVVFSYLMTLITKPKEEQRPYLDYLAKAFFATQVIGIDPDGEVFRKHLLRSRTLIVDANILIPLLAQDSVNQGYFAYCIGVLSGAGITLCTIPNFLEEVVQHFSWAIKHVQEFGPQSIQVLECALGGGEYRRNECIDGFVRRAAKNDLTIEDYIVDCFGRDLSFTSIRERCSVLGIQLKSINEIADRHHNIWAVREDTEKYIQEQQVYNESPKSEVRIKAEAYAYAICYGWRYLRPESVEEDLWRCSVVSQGGSLNRVARFGPHPMARPVVLRPDSLEEFVKHFIGSEQKVSVSEAMMATYVNSIEYFIDKESYTNFFSPLIRDSEKIYRDNIDLFQNLVEGEITSENLFEYDALERPFVVDALQKRAVEATKAEMASLQVELARTKEEATREAEMARAALNLLSPGARKRLERLAREKKL